MAEEINLVRTGQRVFDPETGVLIYGEGDLIPRERAQELGLLDGPKKSRRARKPAEDRARKPAEDRAPAKKAAKAAKARKR